MFRSQDIQVFIFLTIPQFRKSVVHFWIYILKHNSLSHETWPIDRYK